MIEDDPQVEHAKMMQAMNPAHTHHMQMRPESELERHRPAYYPKAVLKGVIMELLSVLKKAKFSMYSNEMIKEIEEAIKKYEQYGE